MKDAMWIACDDVELVCAVRTGETAAFVELARRYRPALRVVAAQTLGDDATADDVVQDALLIAFRWLTTGRDIERVGPWLYTITRRRALRYARDARRLVPSSEVEELLTERSVTFVLTPAQAVERRETVQEVTAALDRLPPHYGLVVRLHYWTGMSQPEIAEFLDLPLTTVKWRLHKAKQALRAALSMRKEDRNDRKP